MVRLPAPAGGDVTLRRLYVPELPPEGGAVRLDEAASRHVRVLRLRAGDEVELFDGSGSRAQARVASTNGPVVCDALAPVFSAIKHTRVVLMLAIPKGSKLDDCIRMGTELGVDEVALMQTERTIPRWDAGRTQARIERLTRIAAEAAGQCERSDVPRVRGPKPYHALLRELPAGAMGVLFGARAKGALALPSTPEQVWCAIGPEGGFTEAEVDAFRDAGFALASLGNRVLRVDTAVAAALSIVTDRLDALLQAR